MQAAPHGTHHSPLNPGGITQHQAIPVPDGTRGLDPTDSDPHLQRLRAAGLDIPGLAAGLARDSWSGRLNPAPSPR